jgi:hypothetical protein
VPGCRISANDITGRASAALPRGGRHHLRGSPLGLDMQYRRSPHIRSDSVGASAFTHDLLAFAVPPSHKRPLQDLTRRDH